MQESKKTENNYSDFERYAYMGFMYVKPEHRGKGVNKLLLDELINWAKSKDISEVRLDIYSENESAAKAYEKAGFSSLITTMRRKI